MTRQTTGTKHRTTDGSRQFCGWNIDDVQFLALGGGPQCDADPD